jgi:hypothetical protein
MELVFAISVIAAMAFGYTIATLRRTGFSTAVMPDTCEPIRLADGLWFPKAKTEPPPPPPAPPAPCSRNAETRRTLRGNE